MNDRAEKERIFNDRKLIPVPVLRQKRAAAERRGPLSDAELLRLAEATFAFTRVVPLNPADLRLRPEVRSWCAPDKCIRCDKTWTCPPACGSLDELEPKIRRFARGLLLVHEAKIRDMRDYPGMQDAGQTHKRAVLDFYATLLGTYPAAVALSAGSCSFCADCTYPDAPCRFPDFAFPSMEACGLLVSEVLAQHGLEFYTGNENKMSFVSCLLVD